jgi:hypothetical protein
MLFDDRVLVELGTVQESARDPTKVLYGHHDGDG